MSLKIWQHRFARRVAERCGRVVIQVDHQVFRFLLRLLLLMLAIRTARPAVAPYH